MRLGWVGLLNLRYAQGNICRDGGRYAGPRPNLTQYNNKSGPASSFSQKSFFIPNLNKSYSGFDRV